MATHTTTHTTDDITGETGATRRTFAVGPTTYEIDLTDTTWADLLAAVEQFTDAARPVTPATRARAARSQLAPRKPGPNHGALGYDAAEVRAWARDAGVDVPPRGRIAADTVAAWRQATGGTQDAA